MNTVLCKLRHTAGVRAHALLLFVAQPFAAAVPAATCSLFTAVVSTGVLTACLWMVAG
jgi:hypothetical protein